jgi:hypothetical protein
VIISFERFSDSGLWFIRRKVANRPLAALGVGGPSSGKGGEHA